MERDQNINTELENMGWTVIRFWGKQVKTDLEGCIKVIEKELKKNSI